MTQGVTWRPRGIPRGKASRKQWDARRDPVSTKEIEPFRPTSGLLLRAAVGALAVEGAPGRGRAELHREKLRVIAAFREADEQNPPARNPLMRPLFRQQSKLPDSNGLRPASWQGRPCRLSRFTCGKACATTRRPYPRRGSPCTRPSLRALPAVRCVPLSPWQQPWRSRPSRAVGAPPHRSRAPVLQAKQDARVERATFATRPWFAGRTGSAARRAVPQDRSDARA